MRVGIGLREGHSAVQSSSGVDHRCDQYECNAAALKVLSSPTSERGRLSHQGEIR